MTYVPAMSHNWRRNRNKKTGSEGRCSSEGNSCPTHTQTDVIPWSFEDLYTIFNCTKGGRRERGEEEEREGGRERGREGGREGEREGEREGGREEGREEGREGGKERKERKRTRE